MEVQYLPQNKRSETSGKYRSMSALYKYYEVGRKMAICVGSAHYFNKSETLVLVAFKGKSQVATIEISLSDYSILQCRGYANGSCERRSPHRTPIEIKTM